MPAPARPDGLQTAHQPTEGQRLGQERPACGVLEVCAEKTADVFATTNCHVALLHQAKQAATYGAIHRIKTKRGT